MEFKDANGQIKTSVLVIAGVGILGVMYVLGKSGGGSASPAPVVSGGQSSAITGQLNELNAAVLSLNDRLKTSPSPTPTPVPTPTPTTNPTPTTTPNPTPAPTTPAPTASPILNWLQQVISQSGLPTRTNPTNPISPMQYEPNTAAFNLGIDTGEVEGSIRSGDMSRYGAFLQSYVNTVSPGPIAASDDLRQRIQTIAQGVPSKLPMPYRPTIQLPQLTEPNARILPIEMPVPDSRHEMTGALRGAFLRQFDRLPNNRPDVQIPPLPNPQ